MAKIDLRMPDDLLAQSNQRGATLSDSIRESLARYFYLLAESRSRLAAIISAEELSLLCDIYNGTLWEPHTLQGLPWGIEDAEEDYFAKWGVDRSSLLEKLERLSLCDRAALVDTIERFWRATGTGLEVKIESLLR